LAGRLGVGGDSSNTVLLNVEAIAAHLHLEEAVNTPVGAPRVTAPPEGLLGNLVDTESGDGDLVVDETESHLLRVDTSSVVFESVGNVNTT